MSVVFSGSSTNKTDRHVITEILLKVALITIKQTNKLSVYATILVFYVVVRVCVFVCVVVWGYFVLILFLLCVFSLFFVWLFLFIRLFAYLCLFVFCVFSFICFFFVFVLCLVYLGNQSSYSQTTNGDNFIQV